MSIDARFVSRLEAVSEIEGSMSPAPTTGMVWLLLSSSPNSCKLPDEFFASIRLSAIVLRGELGSRFETGSNGPRSGVGILSPFLENRQGVGRLSLKDTLFLEENLGVLSSNKCLFLTSSLYRSMEFRIERGTALV